MNYDQYWKDFKNIFRNKGLGNSTEYTLGTQRFFKFNMNMRGGGQTTVAISYLQGAGIIDIAFIDVGPYQGAVRKFMCRTILNEANKKFPIGDITFGPMDNLVIKREIYINQTSGPEELFKVLCCMYAVIDEVYPELHV